MLSKRNCCLPITKLKNDLLVNSNFVFIIIYILVYILYYHKSCSKKLISKALNNVDFHTGIVNNIPQLQYIFAISPY